MVKKKQKQLSSGARLSLSLQKKTNFHADGGPGEFPRHSVFPMNSNLNVIITTSGDQPVGIAGISQKSQMT